MLSYISDQLPRIIGENKIHFWQPISRKTVGPMVIAILTETNGTTHRSQWCYVRPTKSNTWKKCAHFVLAFVIIKFHHISCCSLSLCELFYLLTFLLLFCRRNVCLFFFRLLCESYSSAKISINNYNQCVCSGSACFFPNKINARAYNSSCLVYFMQLLFSACVRRFFFVCSHRLFSHLN